MYQSTRGLEMGRRVGSKTVGKSLGGMIRKDLDGASGDCFQVGGSGSFMCVMLVEGFQIIGIRIRVRGLRVQVNVVNFESIGLDSLERAVALLTLCTTVSVITADFLSFRIGDAGLTGRALTGTRGGWCGGSHWG